MRVGSGWRPALRIARRAARRTRGRSLLVVLLIAVPVLGLSAGTVLLASTRSTLDERLHYLLGGTQALLTVQGGPGDRIEQGVEGGAAVESSGAAADPARLDPRTVLPAGTRTLAVSTGAAVFRTPDADVSVAVEAGPSWDPALAGPYRLDSGRRPARDDEVLLTPAALTRLGTHVGGTIRTSDGAARVLHVVGTAADADQPRTSSIVFGAADLLPADQRTPDTTRYWVVDRPVDAALVARLNAAGTTAFSRAFVAHPSASAVRLSAGGTGPDLTLVVAVALFVVFSVLEVALLAGAAFLVGARQQQRLLAVLASIGADRSVLRRVVSANGVVLGAVGGVAGVGLGVLAAAVLVRVLGDGTWSRFPGLHLDGPVLVGIAVFGLVVGWLAALVPARAAARFDVVRALRGARTPQRTGRRPLIGVVLLVAGVVAVLLSGGVLLASVRTTTEGDRNPLVVLAVGLLGGGSVLAQVGVILCSGLVLRGVSRLLRRAPLAARLAARDTSRNLGRAVPALASVMTTVFVAAVAVCLAQTASNTSAAYYGWNAARPGLGESSIPSRSSVATAADAAAATAVVRRDLPVRAITTVSTTTSDPDDAHPSSAARDALPRVRFPQLPATCGEAARRSTADLRCGVFTASGGHAVEAQQAVSVGDESGLALVLGHAPSAAALAALRSGGAVALRSDVAPGGTARIDWFTPEQLVEGDPATLQPVRVSAIAAVVDLPDHPLQDSLFTTAATAARLGLRVHPDRLLASFTRPPTQAELDTSATALSALANAPDGTWMRVEQGPQDFGVQVAWWVVLGCLVIAIAAAATAIGLARVDGRADDLTLSALGASRRVRRTTGAVQALLVCGLGAVIGTLLGLLPPIAIGRASASYAFAPPVLQLVLIAVGIPSAIAAGAWVLVGRRGDLTRRTAIT